MLNLKLKTIANLVEKDDIVIDTCCDHAYLAIYLKENNLCKEVYASDINENALNNAKKNIKKKNLCIKTFLSDGFKNINVENINTAIIAGVGTSTVIHIIKYAPKNIKKFIVSSNNNHYELRKTLYQHGLYNEKELVVKDHNKFYTINVFTKNKIKGKKFTLQFGKSNNIEYFHYLIKKEKDIISHIPKKHFIKIYNHKKNIKKLESFIKRNEDCC